MANNNSSKVKRPVSAEEQYKIKRAVWEWLKTFPDLPGRMEVDFLAKDAGIAFTSVPNTALIIKGPYILGGYLAQYQFDVFYRCTAQNSDERLAADELLNTLAHWMKHNVPAPPPGVNWWKVTAYSMATLNAYSDSGAEEHAITITLNYEVI